jgi:hypothetical protein
MHTTPDAERASELPVRRLTAGRKSNALDRLGNTCNLVNRQVIHHHDVALGQRRQQECQHIGEEYLTIHWPVDHHRCGDLVMAQCRDECRELPVAVRCLSDQSLAFRRSAAQARHVCAGAGFIDENQSPRVNRGLLLSPFLASRLNVFAVLLGGVQRFF